MLTTQEAADLMGVAYQTVMAWVYQGKFPNAQKEETPRGIYYLIPMSDINGFEKPKRGRPPASKSETASTKKRARKVA
jgi:excisionase family DNA binding protein